MNGQPRKYPARGCVGLCQTNSTHASRTGTEEDAGDDCDRPRPPPPSLAPKPGRRASTVLGPSLTSPHSSSIRRPLPRYQLPWHATAERPSKTWLPPATAPRPTTNELQVRQVFRLLSPTYMRMYYSSGSIHGSAYKYTSQFNLYWSCSV